MKTITNPTTEQIKNAMKIVNKSEQSACITGERYALTKYGTFLQGGNISTPKSHIKAVRYICTYGETCGSVHYVLEGLSMYHRIDIVAAGFTPVAADEIPQHFDNIVTIIQEN